MTLFHRQFKKVLGQCLVHVGRVLLQTTPLSGTGCCFEILWYVGVGFKQAVTKHLFKQMNLLK